MLHNSGGIECCQLLEQIFETGAQVLLPLHGMLLYAARKEGLEGRFKVRLCAVALNIADSMAQKAA